jgi:SNF2 family DNA or RNA helicase
VSDLFDSQIQRIEFARGKPAFFDASEPGTGKTRVQIELFRARILSDNRPVLVLAPKTIMRAAWANDIRKFAPELLISIASAENRDKAFALPANVYITNHDAAKWLAAQPKSFWKRLNPSTIAMDESGAYKHDSAQRSKAMGKIVPYFEFRSALNGTPNTNTILDVWHQYKLLDGGQRLGKSFYAFRSSVCVPEQVGPRAEHIKWVDKPGAELAVADLVKDITMRHTLDDLPENRLYTVPFVLKPRHMAQYKTMQATELLPLQHGAEVVAINAAAVSTKLLQIASGAVYENPDVYHLLDSDRYELVMDLIEERRHTLVFFQWKHQKAELLRAAERRGLTYNVIDGEETSDKVREAIVRNFQAGFYRVLFAHPKSAAHGLTLVKATRTIWASPTFNLEHFEQGNKRIHRKGQTEKTETIVVVAEGTIDEKVYAALQTKRVRMDSLLQELKEAA